MASGTLASLVVRVGADIKGFTSDINRATALSRRQSKQMVASFKRVGVGVAAGLAVAINEAVKFEKAMAEVSTLLEDTSGIDNLTDSVRELSMQYGQAPTDQAKALYQIISAGASNAADQMALLDAANRLAIGGVTDVATAADGLTTVLNAYGMEAEQAGHVSDLLFVGMKQGKTTIEEMSTSIGAVATIAAQTGVPLNELIAATATLTKSGIATSEAMSGIKGVLSAVMKQSPQAVRMADELGVGFNIAAIESEGFAGWLEKVQIATGGSAEKLAKLFGRVEGLTAVMSLGADGASEYKNILEETANAAGATDEAYAKMAETVSNQLGQLKATATVLAGVLGEALLPTLNLLAEGLLRVMTHTNNLEESQEAAAVAARSLGDMLRRNASIEEYADGIEHSKKQIIDLERQINKLLPEVERQERFFGKAKAATMEAARAVADLKDRQKTLHKGISAANKEIDKSTAKTKIATKQSRSYEMAIKDMATGFDWLDNHVKKATRSQEQLNDAYRQIIDTFVPMKAAQLAHEERLEKIEALHRSGRLVGEEYNQVIREEAEMYKKAKVAAADFDSELSEVIVTAKKFSGEYPKEMEKVEESTIGVVAVIENSFKRLDDTFQTFWRDLVSNGKLSLNGLKDLFLDTLAQMLHAALTQPIVMRFGAMMTGGLASGAANAGASSLFGAGGFAGALLGGGTGTLLGGIGAGVLGGLGGIALGNNGTFASKAGGGLGAGAGGILGYGMGAAIGGPIGAMVGAAIGSFLGGLAGSLLGGLFGSKKDPRIVGGGMNFKPGDTQFFESALGGVFVGDTKRGMDEHVGEFGEAIVEFDKIMASFMSDSQIARVTDALASWKLTLKDEAISIEAMLEGRFKTVLSTFGQNVQDYVNGFVGLEAQSEALATFVTALNRVGMAIAEFIDSNPADMLVEQLEDAATSSTQKLQGIGDSLLDLFANFDGTPEMLDQITMKVDERYRGELEYLAAVNQLISGINASVDKQIADMRAAIEGPASFAEIMNQVTQLQASLAMAESPEEIAQIFNQIQSLVSTAFNSLDEAGKQLNIDALTAILRASEEAATQRAEALAQMVIDEGVVLREQAAMFAESIGAPLELNAKATDAVNDSINRQTDIIIDTGESRDSLLRELVRLIREGNELETLRT